MMCIWNVYFIKTFNLYCKCDQILYSYLVDFAIISDFKTIYYIWSYLGKESVIFIKFKMSKTIK